MTKQIDLLILEPFYGGSHKQLIDTITDTLTNDSFSYDLITLPAKKWHWKARTSALQLYTKIDFHKTYKTIFCSSVLNLCELLGLYPQLSACHKVVYFHENQLEYPVQKLQERDYQYGYNQIVTAYSANVLLFNSKYNMESFLTKINSYLNKIPGSNFKNFEEAVRYKCHVLYFPLNISPIYVCPHGSTDDGAVNILWAHRWEHDKGPETFFRILFELKRNGLIFKVSVLGEHFNTVPEIFNEAKNTLGKNFIKHWGYLENKYEYYDVLSSCDIAVSTANHEFFGVSMLEAVYFGCFPLCPNRLVYPEIFPRECLYSTTQQLYKKLKQYCLIKSLATSHYKNCEFNMQRFAWNYLYPEYLSHFKVLP